jgi:hypothetical protein
LSWIALIVGVPALLAIFIVGPRHNLPTWAAGLAAGAVAAAWGFSWVHSKRYLALSAQEALDHDHRPPVVYLRSFKDDRHRGVVSLKDRFPLWRFLHPIRTWGAFLNSLDVRTEEELLASVLQHIGPVIAIGRPHEKLPQLGAARVYVDQDSWRQTIHDFLAKAALVVLRLGETPGFYWEVEQAATRMEPHRILLLVPLSRKRYNEFCERAKIHFPKGLPPWNWSALRNLISPNLTGKQKALVYFQADWTPVFVDLTRVRWPRKLRLRMLTRRDYINVFDWALQPVYTQLGIPWQPPRFTFRGVMVILYKAIPALVITLIAAVLLIFAFSSR